MRLWFKSRGVGWYLVSCIATLTTLLLPTGVYLVAPNLQAGGINRFPLAYALAVLPTLIWCVLSDRSRQPLDNVTVRRWQVPLLDLGGTFVPSLVISGGMFAISSPASLSIGRNVVFFTCIGVTTLAFTKSYAAFAPSVLYLLACATMGFGYLAQEPSMWAFVLGEWNGPQDMLVLAISIPIACVLFVRFRARLY